jgi:hypothetical protein
LFSLISHIKFLVIIKIPLVSWYLASLYIFKITSLLFFFFSLLLSFSFLLYKTSLYFTMQFTFVFCFLHILSMILSSVHSHSDHDSVLIVFCLALAFHLPSCPDYLLSFLSFRSISYLLSPFVDYSTLLVLSQIFSSSLLPISYYNINGFEIRSSK